MSTTIFEEHGLTVSIDAPFLHIEWESGDTHSHHFEWLRHNSSDPATHDPHTKQRLVTLRELPRNLSLCGVDAHDEQLVLDWGESQPRTTLDLKWLRDHGQPANPNLQRLLPTPTTWRANEASMFNRHDYTKLQSDPTVKEKCLRDFFRQGYVIINGVGTDENTVTKVCEQFGYVRPTNYGSLFDVLTAPDPDHLAYTPVGLDVHTDNGYRFATPSVQLLHCIDPGDGGGKSTLVDGLALYRHFLESDPEATNLLANVHVPYRYRDGETDLYARKPIFVPGEFPDELQAIHFNERTMQAPILDPTHADQFMRAMRQLSELAHSPEFVFEFQLSAGEVLIFNNVRLLHGRRPYAAKSKRHLQGCYSDIDGFESMWRVLSQGQS